MSQALADGGVVRNDRWSLGLASCFAVCSSAHALAGQSCYATGGSMTPSGWRAPTPDRQTRPVSGLKLVREIPLPGPANRFDYQSFDPGTGRIYMNHMNAGRTIVFDADSSRIITEITDVPREIGR